MSLLKKILIALFIVFVAIQFIQPAHNKSNRILATDISGVVKIPDSVQTLLKNACYDCHSNNTNYPWYSNIQPMGWLLARHIKNGKMDLNFSEFGVYSIRRQQSKLKSIGSQITDGEMPLSSYKWMHPKARLSAGEKTLIVAWAQKVKDSLNREH